MFLRTGLIAIDSERIPDSSYSRRNTASPPRISHSHLLHLLISPFFFLLLFDSLLFFKDSNNLNGQHFTIGNSSETRDAPPSLLCPLSPSLTSSLVLLPPLPTLFISILLISVLNPVSTIESSGWSGFSCNYNNNPCQL